jgi:cell division protein FtsQ
VTPGATSAPPRPKPPIDPRLRARRIAVKRDEGRRRLRRLLAAGVVAAVLTAGAVATRSPLLDVDHLTVRGAGRTPVGAVVEASGIEIGDPMTDVDAGGATARIETLPWVADANVRRRWPGRVELVVTEREPVAGVAAGERWAVVDGTGRVLEHVTEQPAGLPVLSSGAAVGEPGTAVGPEAADGLAVASALPPPLAERVAVVRAGEGTVRLELRPAGVVELGGIAQLEEKLLAVLTVLDDVDPAALATLDVRVPTAPVLTRRG